MGFVKKPIIFVEFIFRSNYTSMNNLLLFSNLQSVILKKKSY